MHLLRSHLLNNHVTTRNALRRSRLASFVADALILLEFLVGDDHVDLQACLLCHVPMAHLRISYFQNDEHSENLTCFIKHGLFSLMSRLGLQEQLHLPHSSGHCYVFHREEMFACALIKL